MRDVSVLSFILTSLGLLLASALAFFALARWGFNKAWGELRNLRQERVRRASGLLSPALESARLDPFQHLPRDLLPEGLQFEPLCEPCQAVGESQDPLLSAVAEWESHHHGVSHSFVETLGHVARHRLVPHSDLHQRIEPIGEAIRQLIEECPEPSLRKELHMAYDGLKTGAEQNLEYVARRMREAAHDSHTAFHASLGSIHSEFGQVRESMIDSICAEATKEIDQFLENHRAFRFNPVEWGRQAAYYGEFEQLRCELEMARRAGGLSQIALIVMMIVEDENRFVKHLHAANLRRDELHRKLSTELRKSADQLNSEARVLTGWAALENRRLQSAVSHQLIQHLERWMNGGGSDPKRTDNHRISSWIAELAKLRDQDPELAPAAA
jgi:hypothetical protein